MRLYRKLTSSRSVGFVSWSTPSVLSYAVTCIYLHTWYRPGLSYRSYHAFTRKTLCEIIFRGEKNVELTFSSLFNHLLNSVIWVHLLEKVSASLLATIENLKIYIWKSHYFNHFYIIYIWNYDNGFTNFGISCDSSGLSYFNLSQVWVLPMFDIPVEFTYWDSSGVYMCKPIVN